MEVTFDPVKDASNVRDRNLSFTLLEQLDWAGAMVEEDTRKACGERRFRVLGFIGERLHTVVFTPRAGKVHVIMPAQCQFERGQEICRNVQILS